MTTEQLILLAIITTVIYTLAYWMVYIFQKKRGKKYFIVYEVERKKADGTLEKNTINAEVGLTVPLDSYEKLCSIERDIGKTEKAHRVTIINWKEWR